VRLGADPLSAWRGISPVSRDMDTFHFGLLRSRPVGTSGVQRAWIWKSMRMQRLGLRVMWNGRDAHGRAVRRSPGFYSLEGECLIST